jgi:hypothetical protein
LEVAVHAHTRRIGSLLALLLVGGFALHAGGTTIFSAAAGNVAGLQAEVDAFRAELGAQNPNVPGSFGAGRREINWDGTPDARAAPNLLPLDFFNVNSPRGVVFATPGSGVQVSGANGAPVEFANIDPSYPALFTTFSPLRLFTAIGSNVVDVQFFVPGSTTAAVTEGFGAVFTDVDVPNVTSLQFFDRQGSSLGTFFVPAASGDETLSFLGVAFDDAVVNRVRIVAGNQALAPGVTSGDLVALDDFIYGEPRAAPVPEPSTLALLAAAGAALLLRRRTRRAQGLLL